MNLKEKDSRGILRSRWEQWVRKDVTQKEERLLGSRGKVVESELHRLGC
jgi:hypothetical protein